MIYVDQPKMYPGKRKLYCHMISSVSLEELHDFAATIGVKPHFFHRGDHYDLREHEYVKALVYGAALVSTRDIVRLKVNK